MIEFVVNDVTLRYKTHGDLFSPSKPDKGTLTMLSVINVKPEDKVLDLGCGYGLVGIYLSKVVGCQNVVMSDIDPMAVEIARCNVGLNEVDVRVLQSDGFDNLEERDFNLVLSNPPYHTDFSVPKRFIEGAFHHLALGGRLAMVTKRRKWYENKMRAVFGGVFVTEKDGYFIFESEKRSYQTPKRKPQKKMTKKHMKRISRADRNRR